MPSSSLTPFFIGPSGEPEDGSSSLATLTSRTCMDCFDFLGLLVCKRDVNGVSTATVDAAALRNLGSGILGAFLSASRSNTRAPRGPGVLRVRYRLRYRSLANRGEQNWRVQDLRFSRTWLHVILPMNRGVRSNLPEGERADSSPQFVHDEKHDSVAHVVPVRLCWLAQCGWSPMRSVKPLQAIAIQDGLAAVGAGGEHRHRFECPSGAVLVGGVHSEVSLLNRRRALSSPPSV